ncbi:neurotrypsin-like [Penaeus japonicus]|uniref:neurotrypsin-like n=1 Tax=Penaeus japonicus TaxID=27405 RepID=UPI001C70BF84|nr:neurotrypsin-like [Penaeus japonicus]
MLQKLKAPSKGHRRHKSDPHANEGALVYNAARSLDATGEKQQLDMAKQQHISRNVTSMLLLLTTYCVIFSFAQDVSGIGRVRLTGGRNNYEGNLQVEVDGVWGYVCDDGFGFPEADLFCREIGHNGAESFTRNNQFGVNSPEWRRSRVRYWLDDLSCEDAPSLKECSSSALGDHDCGPTQIAGVVCRSSNSRCSESEFPCSNGRGCIARDSVCNAERDCSDMSDERAELCEDVGVTRLRESNTPLRVPGMVAGTVQVKRHGQWQSLCDFATRFGEAKVLCRNLGYANGWTLPLYRAYLGADGSSRQTEVSECTGEEAWIGECASVEWLSSICSETRDLGVLCSDGGASVRVEGGRTETGGLLQVKLKDTDWAGVCGTGYDDLDAKVACRMMGYEGQALASQILKPHRGPPFWNVILDCIGEETQLHQCRLRLTNNTCTTLAALTCSHVRGTTDAQLKTVLPSNCGLAEDASNRYIGNIAKVRGGVTSSRFDSPWLVSLRVRRELEREGRLLCGGVIISEDFVLTALMELASTTSR